MILDEYNEMADASALGTAVTTEETIGDVIPLKNTLNYPATGRPIYMHMKVVAQVTSASSSTTIFRIKSSSLADVADAASAGTTTEHWASAAIAKATLAPGYVIYSGPLPLGAYNKYVGASSYSSHALTGGTVDVFLTDDVTQWRAYADAIA